MAEDYVLLDPIKVTLVMPGSTAGGALQRAAEFPAAVVSKFLWERGLVVEKTGLYSFLVLFSMGITKGKWSTLLTELLEFKRNYDANVSLASCLPCVAPRARCVIRAWACATCATNCTAVTAATPRPSTSSACTPCLPRDRDEAG